MSASGLTQCHRICAHSPLTVACVHGCVWCAGEAKHGTFFAFWNLCNKTVGAIVTLIVGVALEATGFVPNAPVQSYVTRITIFGFFVGLPMGGLALASLFMARFELDEQAHALVMAAIVRRDQAADGKRHNQVPML